MTAAAANKSPISTYHGLQTLHRRPYAATVATAKRIYFGSCSMAVDGVARPVLSGTALEALATAVGTGNAGLLVRATRPYVKLAIVDPSANSAALGIVITTSTIYTIVTVNVATSSMGAITSTATLVAAAINGHAKAAELLRVTLAGTGATAMVAAAAASMVAITLLGFSQREINNAAGASPLAIGPNNCFSVNSPGDGSGFLLTSTAPVEGGVAYLIDDQTCSAVRASPLDFEAPCMGVETSLGVATGTYYLDLSAAR